jgi:hypothetical protein
MDDMTVQQAEDKVREIFAALVAGTTAYTPADLEAAAHTLHRVAWATDGKAVVTDAKAVARAESMIWNAIALGSRR